MSKQHKQESGIDVFEKVKAILERELGRELGSDSFTWRLHDGETRICIMFLHMNFPPDGRHFWYQMYAPRSQLGIDNYVSTIVMMETRIQ